MEYVPNILKKSFKIFYNSFTDAYTPCICILHRVHYAIVVMYKFIDCTGLFGRVACTGFNGVAVSGVPGLISARVTVEMLTFYIVSDLSCFRYLNMSDLVTYLEISATYVFLFICCLTYTFTKVYNQYHNVDFKPTLRVQRTNSKTSV